ncbi:MAG: MotA/TolQ/ExbB proton channel family protein [Kiritimatiellales bacterium]
MNKRFLNRVQNFSCVVIPAFRRMRTVLLIFGLLIFAFAGVCRADSQTAPDTRTQSEIETSFISQSPAVPESSFLTAIKAFFQKTSLVYIFKKGGPIMWPLLLASVLALGTVMDRIFFLVYERKNRDRNALAQFFEAVRQSDLERAVSIGESSKFYIVRTLGYALQNREKSIANALLYAREQEMKRFRRGIPALDTIITLAPLLGLLGTVTGMMGSFALIGGELSSPGAITGGIAEALIATAFGLGIAITSLIPFNFLNTKMEAANTELESAATQMELLMHPQTGIEFIPGDVPVQDQGWRSPAESLRRWLAGRLSFFKRKYT